MDNGEYILNEVKKKNLKHNLNNNIVAIWVRKNFLGKNLMQVLLLS